jgi:hypothetical protein
MKYLLIVLILLGCAESNSGTEANKAGEPESPDENVVKLSGTLVLDEEVKADEADELTPGEAVAGGVVFLKGYPDQTVATEVDGTFTLAVDVDEMALQKSSTYKVLMWYTTNQTGARFGTKQDITLADASPYSVGTVGLTYTNAVHFNLKDALSGEAVTAECELVMAGFGERLTFEDKGDGTYDSTYMPPDDYELDVSCEGYAEKSHAFTLDAADKVDAWKDVDIMLDAQ